MNDIQRMKELIEKITAADTAYFQKDAPIMSDMEYDKLVLELKSKARYGFLLIPFIEFNQSQVICGVQG